MAGNWYYSEGYYEAFNKDFRSSATAMNTNRSTSASFDRTFDQTYNAVLNYEKQLDQHYVSIMAGMEYYDTYSYGIAASTQALPQMTSEICNLLPAIKDKRGIDSYHINQRILSFFGRANYDYMGKYMLSLVLRETDIQD